MAGAADRARRLGGEAARLRDRAALARARGDENLANSLLDVARRQARQAHRLRKESKASGETPTSAGGEAFDRKRNAALRRAREARLTGDKRAEANHKADAEMYSKLAVQSYQADGIRNRRVRKSEGNLAPEWAAREAKKLAANRKRDAKADAAAKAALSPEARAKRLERDAKRELWTKKRALWKSRRAEQARRLRVQRSTQNNVFDQFVLAQQDLARDRARMTREFTKRRKELDERYGELYETPEEKETFASKHFTKLHAAAGIVSGLRQLAKDRAARHERNMRFDPAYRAKEEAKQAERDKTLIGRTKIKVREGLGRTLDRVSPSRVAIRQENADEARAKTELTEAKKASKGLRATLKAERAKLEALRTQHALHHALRPALTHGAAPDPAVVQRTEARRALAIQAAKVRAARAAIDANIAQVASLRAVHRAEHAKLATLHANVAAAKTPAERLAARALRDKQLSVVKSANGAADLAHAGAVSRAKQLRKDLEAARTKLTADRAAFAALPAPAPGVNTKAASRALIADQVARVKAAAAAVRSNAKKGKDAKETIERVTGAREARRVGSLGYKLGAPKRFVAGKLSAANKRFQVALLTFKTKHGIDKPLLPWQRRTVMQKLFGSDKGYKGVTYHGKGFLGIGDAALLARRGQQGVHPEDHDVANKTPYSLHKGKKGGVYYIGPKGKKVYISHGGVFGFIKAFKSGLGGHRLLR